MQQVSGAIFGKVCPTRALKAPVGAGYRRMWHRVTATLYLGLQCHYPLNLGLRGLSQPDRAVVESAAVVGTQWPPL